MKFVGRFLLCKTFGGYLCGRKTNKTLTIGIKNNIHIDSIKQLEQIKDSRGEFIENLLAAFEKDHPEFIEHLKECGLDEEEIRFCCLEVLGVEE